MIERSDCRIDNWITYSGEFVRINSLTREKIGFFHRLHPGQEIFIPVNEWSLGGVELTKELVVDHLHFVPFKGPNYPEEAAGEYTDGRIILRINEDSLAVFIPNNFPWAASKGIHMDYVCSINYLHQLQNLYYDLFQEELDTEGIIHLIH
jgi:hypothetical protein